MGRMKGVGPEGAHTRVQPPTDEVGEPEGSHGLVGAQPHALVNVLGGAHALQAGWAGWRVYLQHSRRPCTQVRRLSRELRAGRRHH